jgi:uncharacterized membrane protein
MDVLGIALRWAHLAGAILAAGGAAFIAFALLPSMACLDEESRRNLHEQVRRRFSRIYSIGILLLLVSGIYNYAFTEMLQHKGQSLYHALMGVKILLAFGVFFLGSVLLGKSPAFESLRAKRRLYIRVNLLLIAIIVALGAILRAMPTV